MILHLVFLMTRNGKKLLARALYEITASRRPSTKSGYLEPKVIFLRALALILIAPISLVASEDINIDCRKDVSFTFPNYPSSYPNGAYEKWSITAPKGRRILVNCTDFNVERDDTLYLADLVDNQSSKQYTGEGKEFPPFLAKGNELEMTFISLESGRRRGFNVSSSCYDYSSNAVEARIVGGISPGKGFLALQTQSDHWRRVCKDSFDERVAEVVCGQLGYPAVKKVSYGTEDCISAGQDCSKAPICNDYGTHTGTCTCTCTSSISESHTLNPEEQPDENPIIHVILLVFFLITRARARYKTNLIIWAQFQVGFLLFVPISSEASEATNITCRVGVSFTSPNYPSNYPNRANEKWFIMAPKGRRILVTFTDFNVEKDDTLSLADLVDNQSSKQYTGEGKEFPPFLAKGNELEMTFISLRSGTRRGFNVSVSCYDHSSNAVEARIVGSNSPGKGFLELRNGTRSDDWRRVCKDGFDERVTDVVCRELGYPAVRKVSYWTDDCMSAGQDCIKAPICNKYTFTDTFRLEDCSWSSEICSSVDAIKVECYEPGYKGCYDPEDLPQQNGFSFESTSQCVSSCRAITGEALAIMNGKQCFCSTTDEVNLPDITRAADSTCIQNTRGTRQVINSLVYDVSVGFCDELDDVIHGSWDSNITWFGSIVHLTCDDGYSLNGSGTLQCVPGLSPYYPVWNGFVSTCDMSGDGTSTSSPSTTLNPEGTPGGVSTGIGARRLYIGLGIGLCIVLLIVCGVVIYCKKKGLCHMHNKSRETRNGHRSKRTTRKTRTRTSSV